MTESNASIIAAEYGLTKEDLEDLAASTLGDNIERLLRDRASPLSMMMARASAEYTDALLAFVEVPLHTAAGLEQAKLLQAQARRYRDMCSWLRDGLTDAEEVNERLSEEEEEGAVEELKELLHGKREQPAPDA